MSNYDSSVENVIFVASLEEMAREKMIFATKMGMLKLVEGSEFNVAKRTTAATKLGDEDEVVKIAFYSEEQHLIMQTKKGMFLRIEANTIPEKKKGAVGVRGIRLGAEDELEHVYLLLPGESRTVKLKEKELELGRLRVASRDTKGVRHI